MGEDKRDKAIKEAKLVEALRANLRRRKAAPANSPGEAKSPPKRDA